MSEYLKTADVWTVLDLIVAEFTSDPKSIACFDLRLVDRAIELNRTRGWQPMETAPKDGNAVLAYGIHDHVPLDAQRGVKPGDHWWGILVWDVWRQPNQWVFAKDGSLAWSAPQLWMPLPAPFGRAGHV